MSLFQLILLYPIINTQAQAPENEGGALGCVCCGYACYVDENTIGVVDEIGGQYVVNFNDYYAFASNVICSSANLCKTIDNLCTPECFDFDGPSNCDYSCGYSDTSYDCLTPLDPSVNSATISEVLECLMENLAVKKVIISEDIALDKPISIDYRDNLDILVEKGVTISQELNRHPLLFPCNYLEVGNDCRDEDGDGVVSSSEADSDCLEDNKRSWDIPLFTFIDCNDINFIGYGATIKRDVKTNFNHGITGKKYERDAGIALYGCYDFTIEGLVFKECHGDGIQVLVLEYPEANVNKLEYNSNLKFPTAYQDCNTHDFIVSGIAAGYEERCEKITIKNCNFVNNVRTGIGVEDGIEVIIEGCKFYQTANYYGIATQSGIDFEPHRPNMYWTGCEVRNCEFIDNRGGGIIIVDNYYQTQPSDILIENCYFTQNGLRQIEIDVYRHDLPSIYTVSNCFFELNEHPTLVGNFIPVGPGLKYSNTYSGLNTTVRESVFSSYGQKYPFRFKNKRLSDDGFFGYINLTNISIIDKASSDYPLYKVDDADGNCRLGSLAPLNFSNVNLVKKNLAGEPYELVNTIHDDYYSYPENNPDILNCCTEDVYTYQLTYDDEDPINFPYTPYEYYLMYNECDLYEPPSSGTYNIEDVAAIWDEILDFNYFVSEHVVQDPYPFDVNFDSWNQLAENTTEYAQFGDNPIVSLIALDRCGNENENSVAFDIVANGLDEDFAGPLSVRLKYSGSATNCLDYDFMPQFAILMPDLSPSAPSGQYRLSEPIIITARADDESEGIEEIIVTIESCWQPGTTTPTYYTPNPEASSITLSILDMDVSIQDDDGENVKYVYETIRVEQGEELLISDEIMEFIGEDTGIIVEKGGHLIIEGNSTLRGNTCISSSWKGIQVEADYDNPDNNGVIEINGTPTERPLIRDAMKGIYGHSNDSHYIVVNTPSGPADTEHNWGGNIIVNHAQFINNLVSIEFEGYHGDYYDDLIIDGGEIHNISNSEFTIDYHSYPFSIDEHPTHLSFKSCNLPSINIYGNEFTVGPALVLDVETRGTAVKMLESTVKIGFHDIYQIIPENNPLTNHFNGMFKGIDSYSIYSARSPLVYNNRFENVIKGITVNTSASADIRHNTFMIPPTEEGEQSYGLWLESSNGFELYGNVYRTSYDSSFGLFIKDSQLSNFNGSTIRTQYFDGPFDAATTFLGDNTGLSWQCNTYGDYPDKETSDLTPPPQIDWRIANVPLDEMELGGDPNVFGSAPLVNNNWHEAIYGGLHIENLSSATIKIYCDDISAPNEDLIDGLDIGNIASQNPSTVNCSDFPGILPPETDECVSDLEHATTYDVSRGITRNVRDNKEDCVYDILATQDANWSNWILVGSYVGSNDFVRANDVMQSIPILVDRDQQLHDMYSAIIDNQLYGSGKMNDAESMLRNYSQEKGIEGIAESILAYAFGENYNRNFKQRTDDTEELIAKSKSVNFIVYPNPAKDKAFINYIGLEKEYHAEMTVYDINGQEQVSKILENQRDYTLDISAYEQGVYFLAIQGKDTQEMIKLIVY